MKTLKRYDKVGRVTVRSIEITKSPTAGLAITAAAPELVESGTGFLAQIDALHLLEAQVAGEIGATQAAMVSLRQIYNLARALVLEKFPGEPVGPIASMIATPTDLFRFAQALEPSLKRLPTADGPEIQAITEQLNQALESATRLWSEHVTADQALQKAKAAVDESARQMEAKLVGFRRLVRVAFGSRSKEYHSIKMPRDLVRDDGEEVGGETAAKPATETPAKEPEVKSKTDKAA
jgi:hypothetical protein